MKVTLPDGQVMAVTASESDTLEAVADRFKDYYEDDIILGIVNGRLRELNKKIKSDCELSFVTTADRDGRRTYRRSVVLLLQRAISVSYTHLDVYKRQILHSKAFRRLKNKTQVFLTPKGDHYRTRMSHTLEVSQNARTIAKALRLNEALVEAIALGHDLGPTPFGHAGERILNEIYEGGFKHNEQSVRIVEKLEKDGAGLNLTWEVRDGMLNHQTSLMPHTLEGKIVRLSDKIAYINSDFDDAIRAQLLCEDDIPLEIRNTLGHSTKARLNHMAVSYTHLDVYKRQGQCETY